MNVSFEWRIVNVIKKENLDGLQNVILRVVYEYRGTDIDSGETYTMLGGLDLGAPNSNNFTPINEITQEQVLSWLDAHPSVPTMKQAIEASIKHQIDRKDVVSATEISWLDNNNDTSNPTDSAQSDIIVEDK